ncbi:MAG: hypothetical protein QG657_2710 [Acidobacteriota bacterium]|nr:hypothetical protein [Acidobacteriota bacterium]
MSYSVIIKNKLLKGGTVKFWKADRSITAVSNSSTTDVAIGSGTKPVSMAPSEALHVRADAFSMETPVFLAIDSSNPYDIAVEKNETSPGTRADVWTLAFGNLKEKSTARTIAADGTSNPPVNVTVGQDEPKGKTAPVALLISTGATAAFYTVSVPIYKYSKTLWLVITGVLAAAFIGSAIYYLFSKNKGNKVQNNDNI